MKKIDWQFLAVVGTPLVLTAVLALLKIHAIPGLPWWAVLLPVLLPCLSFAVIGVAVLFWVAIVRHSSFRSKRRAVCENCVHCSITDFGKGKLCLSLKDEVSPTQKACEQFENRYKL